MSATIFDVIVIGGGQAGLAMGYYLARQGRSFVILESAEQLGASWMARFDSLRLFTPSQYDSLPGMPFPAPADHYPSKDEVAAYLRAYAAAFDLPVQLGVRVTGVRPALAQTETRLEVETTAGTFATRHIVVATGPFQRPYVPSFAGTLAPDVVQVHSAAYRNPGHLPDGDMLVVGAGNSGAQIAEELAASRPVSLAIGRPPARLPQRFLGRDLFWWLNMVGLMRVTIDTSFGRRLSAKDALIGTNLPRLVRQGRIHVRPRVVDANGHEVTFADGSQMTVRAVVWATGYRPDYSWLHLPVIDHQGRPRHRRGITGVPGLFFLGLYWQHRRDSALLGGVGRDAAYLAEQIEAGARPCGAARRSHEAVNLPAGSLQRDGVVA